MAINSSIPPDPPHEEIHDVYEEFKHANEAKEAEYVVSSPYSDFQGPSDLAFTKRPSPWSPQPSSPSSVNTSESAVCISGRLTTYGF